MSPCFAHDVQFILDNQSDLQSNVHAKTTIQPLQALSLKIISAWQGLAILFSVLVLKAGAAVNAKYT